MPRMPKAFVLFVALFWIPFICLFLPWDFPMDRDWRAPHLAYTTPLHLMAQFFYYIPMVVADALRPLDVDSTFYVGAFLQSLLLTVLTTLLVRALVSSRWRQLASRLPE